MPLQYPIAFTAREALDVELGARTIAEARELAKAPVTLVSEWLRPRPDEREEVQAKAESGVARGFVQLYEDKKGQPVIAVAFWKPVARVKTKPAKKARSAPAKPEASKPEEDHTDDLYFTKAGYSKTGGKAKKSRRASDPKQLDLFAGPDQQGAETPDPHNPSVVIVDEEGDGAAFGIAPPETDEAGES